MSKGASDTSSSGSSEPEGKLSNCEDLAPAGTEEMQTFELDAGITEGEVAQMHQLPQLASSRDPFSLQNPPAAQLGTSHSLLQGAGQLLQFPDATNMMQQRPQPQQGLQLPQHQSQQLQLQRTAAAVADAASPAAVALSGSQRCCSS